MSVIFLIQNIGLGIGLAMDAFSVSLANGLCHPKMALSKSVQIASVFAFFQFLMPLIGWILVHFLLTVFNTIQPYVPYVALVFLCILGIHMIFENHKSIEYDKNSRNQMTIQILLLQGIATSIDALSAGLTFSTYSFGMAIIACVLIAIVTFIICMGGVYLGKRYGLKYASFANSFGGVILILIGIKIAFF